MSEKYTSSCLAVEVTRTPATDILWKHKDKPHITLLYVEDPAGKTYSRQHIMGLGGFHFGNVVVTGVDTFGEDNNYLVLRVESEELHSAHRWYKRSLPKNENSFPKYQAHITVAQHDELTDDEYKQVREVAESFIGKSIPLGDTVLYWDGKTYIMKSDRDTIMGIKPRSNHKQEKKMEMKSLSAIDRFVTKADMVAKTEKGRTVCTPEGAAFFGLPIGAVIPKGWKKPKAGVATHVSGTPIVMSNKRRRKTNRKG